MHPWVRRSLGVLGTAACFVSVVLARIAPGKGAKPTFDEGHYLRLLRFGWQSVLDGSTAAYYAAKSLPFLLAHVLFDFGSSPQWDYPVLYRAMDLFNWGCLLFVAWALARILESQQASHLTPLAWVLLLCNRAFLHFYSFYPILPDIFTLALGSAFWLGFFLKDRRWLWGSYLAATVTNPQLMVMMLVVLAFTRRGVAPGEPIPRTSRQAWWALVLGAPFLVMSLGAFYLFPERTIEITESWGNVLFFRHPLSVALSTVAGALAMWFLAAPLQYWTWRDFLQTLNWKAVLAALILAVAASSVVGSYAADRSAGIAYALRAIVIGSSIMLSKPAPGILSYVVFLGLAGAFAILTWKSLGRWIGLQGPGVALAFSGLLMATGLGGEVRHVIFVLPLVIVGICRVAGEAIARVPLAVWICAGAMLSLNWLVFLALPGYATEPELSAFGMCWSKAQYVGAVVMVAASLWVIRRMVRTAPGAPPSDPRVS